MYSLPCWLEWANQVILVGFQARPFARIRGAFVVRQAAVADDNKTNSYCQLSAYVRHLNVSLWGRRGIR
jgi:hypothetical protein